MDNYSCDVSPRVRVRVQIPEILDEDSHRARRVRKLVTFMLSIHRDIIISQLRDDSPAVRAQEAVVAVHRVQIAVAVVSVQRDVVLPIVDHFFVVSPPVVVIPATKWEQDDCPRAHRVQRLDSSDREAIVEL